MSGEFYCIEEITDIDGFFQTYEKTSSRKEYTHRDNDDGYPEPDKRKSNIRLQEIEQQLQMTENRCNTLKNQLEQMKRVCHKSNKDDTQRRLAKRSLSSDFKENIATKDNFKQNPYSNSAQSEALQPLPVQNVFVVPPIRQNSCAVTTDTSGGAITTINNILTGITESVNRLSNLQTHLDKGSKSARNSRRKNRSVESACQTTATEGKHGDHKGSFVEGVPVSQETLIKQKKKSRQHKTRMDKIQEIKKPIKVTAKHTDKKIQLNTIKTGMIEPSNSTVLNNKRKLKRLQSSSKNVLSRRCSGFEASKQFKQYATENLIELFHNKDIRGSDSDDSNGKGAKIKKDNIKPRERQKAGGDLVPPLDINKKVTNYREDFQNNKQALANGPSGALLPVKDIDYCEPAAPRNEYYSCNVHKTISKNYELPTVASKLKEVAKSYLQAFNFRTIPFCPAKSTTPSHNIGINIQQVMSIMKTRQPLSGISPTLAHNIGLAADKLNSKPLQVLVSTLSSRLGYGRQPCPLIRGNINYQQLQEMAKDIPEEDEEAEDQVCKDGGGDVTVAHTYTAESTAVVNNQNTKNQFIWTASTNQVNCTCVPNQGIGFSQILNKYPNIQSQNINYSGTQDLVKQNTPASLSKISKPRLVKPFKANCIQKQSRPAVAKIRSVEMPQKEANASEKKNKSLKEVLTNLHDEFYLQNRKYEELRKKVDESKGAANEETLKELEKMEKDLNTKEEEITMVVSLYNEVSALKAQVSNLKKRSSQSTVDQKSLIKGYQDPEAAVHLTKLLKQIKSYQLHYKNAGVVSTVN